MTTLTKLERAVLEKLVAGEHSLLEQLRNQIPACRVTRREMTGHGFYAHLDVGDAPTDLHTTFSFGDVHADIQGLTDGAGFELYIEHGRLSMLEGYAYDEPWPSAIRGYALKYDAGEQRDWPALRRLLG
jgi:hypothetical protein